jgi:hypothetical protein
MASQIDANTYIDDNFTIFEKEAKTAVENAKLYSEKFSKKKLDMFLTDKVSEAEITEMARTLFTTR